MMHRIPGRAYDTAFFVGIVLLALLMAYLSPVAYAAPAPKQQEAGCVQFTKAGMWDVYDCHTPDGFHFVANSAGMLVSAGN